jgi:hypothetical protein
MGMMGKIGCVCTVTLAYSPEGQTNISKEENAKAKEWHKFDHKPFVGVIQGECTLWGHNIDVEIES